MNWTQFSQLALGSEYGPSVLTLAGIGGAIAFYLYNAVVGDTTDRAALRSVLLRGGELRELYVRTLTWLLNRLDRLLGDKGRPQAPLKLPFLNREPAHCWTANSFDTCALLATVYPLLGMLAIWVGAGDAGTVGEALGLRPDAPVGTRPIAAIGLAVALFS